MVVVVFRSRLSGEALDEYQRDAARMLELARETPGFISFKAFVAEDGERLSFIEFEDHASVLAWKSHPEHAAAQTRGKAAYYSEYRVQACDVVRSYGFSRETQG